MYTNKKKVTSKPDLQFVMQNWFCLDSNFCFFCWLWHACSVLSSVICQLYFSNIWMKTKGRGRQMVNKVNKGEYKLILLRYSRYGEFKSDI